MNIASHLPFSLQNVFLKRKIRALLIKHKIEYSSLSIRPLREDHILYLVENLGRITKVLILEKPVFMSNHILIGELSNTKERIKHSRYPEFKEIAESKLETEYPKILLEKYYREKNVWSENILYWEKREQEWISNHNKWKNDCEEIRKQFCSTCEGVRWVSSMKSGEGSSRCPDCYYRPIEEPTLPPEPLFKEAKPKEPIAPIPNAKAPSEIIEREIDLIAYSNSVPFPPLFFFVYIVVGAESEGVSTLNKFEIRRVADHNVRCFAV
jgi:hypothetical protein